MQRQERYQKWIMLFRLSALSNYEQLVGGRKHKPNLCRHVTHTHIALPFPWIRQKVRHRHADASVFLSNEDANPGSTYLGKHSRPTLRGMYARDTHYIALYVAYRLSKLN